MLRIDYETCCKHLYTCDRELVDVTMSSCSLFILPASAVQRRSMTSADSHEMPLSATRSSTFTQCNSVQHFKQNVGNRVRSEKSTGHLGVNFIHILTAFAATARKALGDAWIVDGDNNFLCHERAKLMHTLHKKCLSEGILLHTKTCKRTDQSGYCRGYQSPRVAASHHHFATVCHTPRPLKMSK